MREDLKTTTVAAERLQILVYRLQVQQEVTAGAHHEVDDAKSKMADAESRRKNLAAALQRSEDARDENVPPAELKSMDTNIAGIKARLEAEQGQEQQVQATEIQAEEQLRIEQSKMSDLEDKLNELDRVLENANRPSVRSDPKFVASLQTQNTHQFAYGGGGFIERSFFFLRQLDLDDLFDAARAQLYRHANE